jgi:hypothetical protein
VERRWVEEDRRRRRDERRGEGLHVEVTPTAATMRSPIAVPGTILNRPPDRVSIRSGTLHCGPVNSLGAYNWVSSELDLGGVSYSVRTEQAIKAPRSEGPDFRRLYPLRP